MKVYITFIDLEREKPEVASRRWPVVPRIGEEVRLAELDNNPRIVKRVSWGHIPKQHDEEVEDVQPTAQVHV